MEKLNEWYVQFQSMMRDQKGATMVEYSLMLALIAVVCIAAVGVIGTNTDGVFDQIAAALPAP